MNVSGYRGRLLALALLCGAGAMPALAESSASSSASDSVSTSVGSLSDSIKGSSNSSSKADKVAEGDYQVIDVAELAGQPGLLRLTLRAVAGPDIDAAAEFYLLLPRVAAEQGRIGQGQRVSAQQRPYGIEFSNAQTRQAFFLVLADDWHRELNPRPVVL